MEGADTDSGENVVRRAVELLQRQDASCFDRWVDTTDDLSATDRYGNSAMHWAAALGHLEALRALLRVGENCEVRNAAGSTPMLCAAASCKNPAVIVDFFVRHGALTSVVNDSGEDVFSLLRCRGFNSFGDCLESLTSLRQQNPQLFATGADAVLQVKDLERFGSAIGTLPLDYPSPAANANTPFTETSKKPSAFTHLSRTTTTASTNSTGLRRMETLLSEEECSREILQRTYAEDLLELLSIKIALLTRMFSDCLDTITTAEEEESTVGDGESAGRDSVVAVHGERHDLDGGRVLLVEWRVPRHSPPETPSATPENLEWVPFEEVKDSPVVKDYVRRFDGTYSETTLQLAEDGVGTPLDQTASQCAIGAEEREELERMLDMIPRRSHSMETTGTWQSSPLTGPVARAFADNGESSYAQRSVSDGRARSTPAALTERSSDDYVQRLPAVPTGKYSCAEREQWTEFADTERDNCDPVASVDDDVQCFCTEVEEDSKGFNSVMIADTDSRRGPTSNAESSEWARMSDVVRRVNYPHEEVSKPTVSNERRLSRNSAVASPTSPGGAGVCPSLDGQPTPDALSHSVARTSAEVQCRAAKEHEPLLPTSAVRTPATQPVSLPRAHQLSNSEQVSYQKFLYQSALRRLGRQPVGT